MSYLPNKNHITNEIPIVIMFVWFKVMKHILWFPVLLFIYTYLLSSFICVMTFIFFKVIRATAQSHIPRYLFLPHSSSILSLSYIIFCKSVPTSARPNSGNKGMFWLPPVPLVLYRKVWEPSRTSSHKIIPFFSEVNEFALKKITRKEIHFEEFLWQLFKKQNGISPNNLKKTKLVPENIFKKCRFAWILRVPLLVRLPPRYNRTSVPQKISEHSSELFANLPSSEEHSLRSKLLTTQSFFFIQE